MTIPAAGGMAFGGVRAVVASIHAGAEGGASHGGSAIVRHCSDVPTASDGRVHGGSAIVRYCTDVPMAKPGPRPIPSTGLILQGFGDVGRRRGKILAR